MTARHRLLVAATAIALLAGKSRPVSANGSQFFAAAGGKVDLVYFGRVKDARTGRLVADYPYVTITDREVGLYMPFQGDSFGHFKSPDVGAAIKELTSDKVNAANLEVELFVPGYKRVKQTRLPRKTTGAVELDFRLEPIGTPSAPRDETPYQTVWIMVVGCAVLMTIGVAALTRGRPPSTAG